MTRTAITIATTLIITALAITAGANAFAQDHPAGDTASERKTLTLNVYALDTCPISSAILGSMGDPVIKTYGKDAAKREVRFCCTGCVEPFEEDVKGNMEQIDAKLIEQQTPHYALDTCVVSGRSLAESETVVDHIHQGRLVRFCCPGCPSRFKADPDRYLSKLDEAVIKQQREHYPLDTCVVAGMKLGSMGEPYEIIVGGTLVRFCCAGCVDGFKEDPATHLATIRDAWREQHDAQGDDH